jgi:hypothetical protein
LGLVVASWNTLPEAIRAGIVAMVRASAAVKSEDDPAPHDPRRL